MSSADPLLIFDFADEAGILRRHVFRQPLETVVAYDIVDVLPKLHRVQQAVDAGAYAAGYVAYEAAPAFDSAYRVPANAEFPLVWFGLFTRPEIDTPIPEPGGTGPASWEAMTTPEQYAGSIRTIRNAIANGETYQVNYTIRLRSRSITNRYAYYQQMRQAQQAGYCAFLDLGRHTILSASPELFFRRSGSHIEVRPMKGTSRRGRWQEEDQEMAARLSSSEKERAENLMIVDLLRNDLGRIAEFGSVRVTSLFHVERYPTLWQMTSAIEATIPDATTLGDLFTALFPCGSVTGAPKVNTMRHIARLEPTPRQIYCGAIGYLTPGKTAVFNVAIRTVLHDNETGITEYGVGGGITWDSAVESEYAEIQTKSAVVRESPPEFALLETLRLENGQYFYLDRHLHRLARSAEYFGIPCQLDTVRARLVALAVEARTATYRVRLTVERDGRVDLQCQPLLDWPALPLQVAVSDLPISSADPFLFHKTTRRRIYEQQRARYPDAFDVLLVNERGELTEFTLGNLVVEWEGQRWTPPQHCGLLAGTLRAELVEQGTLQERVLTRDHLSRASALWLINSVRGQVPVVLHPSQSL